MPNSKAKGVIDPRLSSFAYDFNTLINYFETTGKDFEQEDSKVLMGYFNSIKSQIESGREVVLPKNNVAVLKILRALAYAGMKDDNPDLSVVDVGKMLSSRTLLAGALEAILSGIRKGTVASPNE